MNENESPELRAINELKNALASNNRKNRRVLFAVVSIAVLSLGFSAYSAYAASTYSFATGQTFTVAAQYSFGGPSPNSMTLYPGASGNFNLTLSNNSGQTTTAYIYFQASNPTQFLFPGYTSAQQGCPITNASTALYTMSLNGQQIAANNATAPSQGACVVPATWPASVHSLTVNAGPGKTIILGTVAVSGSATAGQTFALSWFASTAQPA